MWQIADSSAEGIIFFKPITYSSSLDSKPPLCKLQGEARRRFPKLLGSVGLGTGYSSLNAIYLWTFGNRSQPPGQSHRLQDTNLLSACPPPQGGRFSAFEAYRGASR